MLHCTDLAFDSYYNRFVQGMTAKEELDMLKELDHLTELGELDPQRITYARGYVVDQVKVRDLLA
jgi:hypothetical protein